MKKFLCFFSPLLLILILPFSLLANLEEEITEGIQSEGITVDLCNPSYSNGVLSTDEGGIISGPKFRVQARRICYTRKNSSEEVCNQFVAEEDVLISFGPYVFVGDRVEYDFVLQQGVVYNGRSAIEPWYFGGKEIYLLPNGNIKIIDGHFTTSERICPEWAIESRSTVIDPDHNFIAKGVRFRIYQYPFFYLPKLCANLDWIFDSPIRYRIRWGGKKGFRMGLIYEVFDWNNFATFLRLDYLIRRGPGGGFETYYESPVKNHWFHTTNYVANDFSIDDPKQRLRWRLEGIYYNEWDCGRTSTNFSYDYLSDIDMPTDYDDNGLNYETAQPTQINIRRQQDDFVVANFFTRVRINDFQTIKQELPSVAGIFHPFNIGSSGIISDNRINMGYFDFVYSDDEEDVTDFNATRFQFFHRIYRPFTFGPFVATPSAEVAAILYGSGPSRNVEWLALGSFGGEVKTSFYKIYGCAKHVIEPYGLYEYITDPTIDPNEHFIFDITDGWFKLNTIRFGARNLIYRKPDQGIISPYLTLDLYTYAFIQTPTLPNGFPYGYLDVEWNPTYRMSYYLSTGWDFVRNQLNFINIRSEVTLSDYIAFAGEFRHRTPFRWRKVNHSNYILDSFRTQEQLRDSLVSDRRNTLLYHIYARLDPSFALDFEIRHGWNRITEPSYTEYGLDAIVFLRSSWIMRLSYQKKEDEHRITCYLTLAGTPH